MVIIAAPPACSATRRTRTTKWGRSPRRRVAAHAARGLRRWWAPGPRLAAHRAGVPHWRRGRMVLVGDAVHAPSNSSGQGAALAIESAVLLARCLRDHAKARSWWPGP
ncbi:FAD-dependent monooxygenase [Thermocatellispora tengchongensis]